MNFAGMGNMCDGDITYAVERGAHAGWLADKLSLRETSIGCA